MRKQKTDTESQFMPEKSLKELFVQSHDRGCVGLPVMSLSMSRGLVPRNQDERRVETNLSDEQHRLVRAGELAYNMMRMWQGVCSLAEEDCLVSPAYIVVRPLKGMDSKFSEYLLTYEETVTKFKRLSFGVVDDRLRLYFKDFERVRVRTPSHPVQRKIARILTTLDNLIEKTESLIAKYQAIKQGMMHDLFTRGVDAHGHLRPPQAEASDIYKKSQLGWIPKDWETCRVDEVGSVKLGRQRSPKHQSGRFTTPYLRVANVFDGSIDYSDVLEMDFTPTEKESYSLLPGDVLLNEGQSLELVGRSAIYEGEPHRFCFQNTLIRFRAYPPNDPRFCRGIFKYYIDIGRFMTIARQTTSVAHLGADRLAKLAFPRPHPDEQLRIAFIFLIFMTS